MKKIKYQALVLPAGLGAEEIQDMEPLFTTMVICCNTQAEVEANLPIVQREAYNGEYTIEDDGLEIVAEPSQLDRLEAQVTYTAIVTDTLLEV